MKKKIGILTFHRADNCGALLQAYALCETMKTLCGNDIVEIIDYRGKALEKANSVFPFEFSRMLPKSLIRSILRLPFVLRIKKPFTWFRDTYLTLSPRSYDKGSIGCALERYGQFLVGSDQVFNMNLIKDDVVWFLDFVPDTEMRHSYAASFGNVLSFEKNKLEVMEHLRRFKSVSLREDTGISTLLENQIPCKRHLDPVFLFTKEKWLHMAKAQTLRKPYLLYYEIRPEKNLFASSKVYAKQNNLELLCVSQRIRFYPMSKRVFSLDPLSFIDTISKAECVFTTSFHALAFSLLLEKDFYTETIDATGETNNRIKDLLHLVALENRDIAANKKQTITEAIDWVRVGVIIENERKRSLSFLSSIGM